MLFLLGINMGLFNLTEWDFFYKTGRWQRLRRMQLRRHPLCKFCLERGIFYSAYTADGCCHFMRPSRLAPI
jgi:5-methylcytosine-specific restriction endonuclease McrA